MKKSMQLKNQHKNSSTKFIKNQNSDQKIKSDNIQSYQFFILTLV